LPPELITRYARTYGTRTEKLLAGRTCIADMGNEIASGLYEAEVDYLMRLEWATSAADILWRRSKLGLHLPAGTEEMLDSWIRMNRSRSSSAAASI
jgi:glycerol-3-phosphate dehydrogenase